MEDPPVEGHSKDDLITGDTVVDVGVDDGVRVEGGAGWAGGRVVDVGEVACVSIPGSCEVVRLMIVSIGGSL